MWRRVAFGLLLASSLGLNGYVLLAPPSAAPPARAARAVAKPPTTKQLSARQRTPPAQSSELDRSALEQRLANAEDRLEDLLPLQEKFERDARVPDHETRARAVLDNHGLGAYQIECHRTVCLFKPDETIEDWMSTLQTRGDIATSFGGTESGDTGVYLGILEKPLPAEYRYRTTLLYALASSPAFLQGRHRRRLP